METIYFDILGKYPPCEDQITYCSQLGKDACTQKIYQGFIRLNCRKTCNKCTGNCSINVHNVYLETVRNKINVHMYFLLNVQKKGAYVYFIMDKSKMSVHIYILLNVKSKIRVHIYICEM